MPSKRIAYFDVARAFAIAAVIVSHTAPVESLVHDLCFTFDLPLFFLTSGYFLRPERRLDRRFLVRSLRSVMLPYAVTCLIVIGLSGVRGVLLASESACGNMARWALASLYGAGDAFQSWPAVLFGSIGAIWFLPALFFVRLGLVTINGLRKEWAKAIAVVLLLLLGLWSRNFIWLPMSIQPAMVSLPFAYAGQLVRRSGLLDARRHTNVVWPLMALTFAGLVLLGGHMYLSVAYFYDGVLVGLAGGIVGSLCVLKLSQWLCGLARNGLRALEWTGRSTLAILCMHLVEMNVGPLTVPIVVATLAGAWLVQLAVRVATIVALCAVAWALPPLRRVYYLKG